MVRLSGVLEMNDEKSKLKALRDIVTIDIALDFNNMLQNILKITCETMNAHSGTMMLADETSGELSIAASYGLQQDHSGSAEIRVPFKRGAEVIGLLNVYMADPHQFTEEEINFVNIAASQASSVVQNRDVTEKIKMQHELKESEAKYREIFENALEAMCVFDAKSNILKINNIGLKILSCTKDEIIGSNISKWLTPESLEIVKERQRKRLSGEIANKTDVLEIVCRNGEHRWIEIETKDVKDDDRIIEIHGIARDITDKMKLMQELNKSNKQRKLLCYLIEGTRGGKTRALILKHLIDKSYNAHQLAKTLDIDYKTVRHHLKVLVKNKIITKDRDGYTDIYSLSKNIESDLNEFNQKTSGDGIIGNKLVRMGKKSLRESKEAR